MINEILTLTWTLPQAFTLPSQSTTLKRSCDDIFGTAADIASKTDPFKTMDGLSGFTGPWGSTKQFSHLVQQRWILLCCLIVHILDVSFLMFVSTVWRNGESKEQPEVERYYGGICGNKACPNRLFSLFLPIYSHIGNYHVNNNLKVKNYFKENQIVLHKSTN